MTITNRHVMRNLNLSYVRRKFSDLDRVLGCAEHAAAMRLSRSQRHFAILPQGRVQIPPSDYQEASRLFSPPISKPAIACVHRILLSAKLLCCQSLFLSHISHSSRACWQIIARLGQEWQPKLRSLLIPSST